MKGRSEIRGWDYWEGAKGWLDGVERKPVRATVRRPAADLGVSGSGQDFSITD